MAVSRETQQSAIPAFEPTLAGPAAPVPVAPDGFTERAGDVIGPYKLQQPLGEGGMGSVWLAEQTHPVRRQVALKVIKPGMDSKRIIARFEAERQALALMEHPNIAKVLDAGTTPTGRPFFAMELVGDQAITRYCDDHKLGIRQRLELFMPVCLALQHAHQKGIIHRDIKPSNVLISIHDGHPVPKVIDFGLAKALTQQLTESTVITEVGVMLGTPEYMSPEQAGANPLDIDTRSDIYSLGVLLYELMTGAPPIEIRSKSLRFDQILRAIREEEPPKPSTRVAQTRGDAATTVAEQRQTEPNRLGRVLRGELDWIVMKALEKDRARRYQTANGLCMDLERYMNGEPVLAGPPSPTYRLKKLALRYKGLVAAAAAVFFALLLGVIVATWGFVKAKKAEQAAREAEAIATSINSFLRNDLLGQVDPRLNSRHKKITVEQLLGKAAKEIDGKFPDQPLVEAGIRQTIGCSFDSLGNYDAALPHLERAASLYRANEGGAHDNTLQAESHLATVYYHKQQLDAAAELYEKIFATYQRLQGPEAEDTVQAMNNLAAVYMDQTKYDKAGELFHQAHDIRRRANEKGKLTLVSLNNLALYYRHRKDFARARGYAEQCTDLRKEILGADDPETLNAKKNLADVYQDIFDDKKDLDAFAKAEKNYKECLELRTKRLGADHPATLLCMSNLGEMYRKRGNLDAAQPLLEKALSGQREVLGVEHENTLSTMDHLASVYFRRKRLDDTRKLLEECLTVSRREFPKHRRTLAAMANLGGFYVLDKKADLAEPLFAQSVAMATDLFGRDSNEVCEYQRKQAAFYIQSAQPAKAQPLLASLMPRARQVCGPDHTITLNCYKDLARAELALDHPDRAEPIARAFLEAAKKKPDGEPAQTARWLLGEALARQKKFQEAEPLLLQAHAGMQKVRATRAAAAGRDELTQIATAIAAMYEAMGRTEDAAAWRERAGKNS